MLYNISVTFCLRPLCCQGACASTLDSWKFPMLLQYYSELHNKKWWCKQAVCWLPVSSVACSQPRWPPQHNPAASSPCHYKCYWLSARIRDANCNPIFSTSHLLWIPFEDGREGKGEKGHGYAFWFSFCLHSRWYWISCERGFQPVSYTHLTLPTSSYV